MEQGSSQLESTPKTSSPFYYIIWVLLSALFMYWPARFIALFFIPSTLERFSSINLGGGEAGEAIGALFITFISFLTILILSIIFSRRLKLRLVLLAFSVLLVMTLILVIVGRNSATRNFNAYKETATQDLLARETGITSPNVKIVGNNLEYNNGVISFTLPSRFVLLHEADNNDNRTVFSDHSDHIIMQLYHGFQEPPYCDWAGYPPCTKNSNGVEIGSTKTGALGGYFRVFSKKPLREFYEFRIESVGDARKEAPETNLDVFNNQLKNSLNF